MRKGFYGKNCAVICHIIVPIEAQIAFALRILCGFGIDEIAEEFFEQ
jgi:predicted RNA polymerase sigma factor